MPANGILLGCIADDMTGATDLANTLVREGMRTVQMIGVPPPGIAVPDSDAVVVALKSRTAPELAGYCSSAPNTCAASRSLRGSPTIKFQPSGSARVRSTASVCGCTS